MYTAWVGVGGGGRDAEGVRNNETGAPHAPPPRVFSRPWWLTESINESDTLLSHPFFFEARRASRFLTFFFTNALSLSHTHAHNTPRITDHRDCFLSLERKRKHAPGTDPHAFSFCSFHFQGGKGGGSFSSVHSLNSPRTQHAKRVSQEGGERKAETGDGKKGVSGRGGGGKVRGVVLSLSSLCVCAHHTTSRHDPPSSPPGSKKRGQSRAHTHTHTHQGRQKGGFPLIWKREKSSRAAAGVFLCLSFGWWSPPPPPILNLNFGSSPDSTPLSSSPLQTRFSSADSTADSTEASSASCWAGSAASASAVAFSASATALRVAAK